MYKNSDKIAVIQQNIQKNIQKGVDKVNIMHYNAFITHKKGERL